MRGKGKVFAKKLVNSSPLLKELAVKGRDLLEAGVERGPMVGKILDHLFDLVLLHPEKNDRELLLKEAGRFSQDREAAAEL